MNFPEQPTRRVVMRLGFPVFILILSFAMPAAQAFEEGPAVPERISASTAAARQRALPEHFAAVAKPVWEDSMPSAPHSTHELIAAVRTGQLAEVKTLLNAGALANGADEQGERPLLAAVAGEHGEIVRLLLQRGASPQVKGPAGRTPLGMAAAAGNLGIVRILLRAGALVDTRSNNGATALHEAVRFDHPTVVHELMAAGPEMARFDREGLHPLALAAVLGRTSCLRNILEAGVDADLPDRAGLTALHWARRYDQVLAESLLVEHHASREAWPIQVD